MTQLESLRWGSLESAPLFRVVSPFVALLWAWWQSYTSSAVKRGVGPRVARFGRGMQGPGNGKMYHAVINKGCAGADQRAAQTGPPRESSRRRVAWGEEEQRNERALPLAAGRGI